MRRLGWNVPCTHSCCSEKMVLLANENTKAASARCSVRRVRGRPEARHRNRDSGHRNNEMTVPDRQKGRRPGIVVSVAERVLGLLSQR